MKLKQINKTCPACKQYVLKKYHQGLNCAKNDILILGHVSDGINVYACDNCKAEFIDEE